MATRLLLDPILQNDRLTAGLDDAEARVLIEWLVERVETFASDEVGVVEKIEKLCRRARAIARFVSLWCHEEMLGAALQLAATERFGWPLPTAKMDAWVLMQDILRWEADSPSLSDVA